MAKTKHLIVVSVDSLNTCHLEAIKELPNFRSILESGSVIRKVTSVYPTQTYPVHVSIITGTYPAKHGVYNNVKCQVGAAGEEWNWQRSNIKVGTISEIARKAGLTVGLIFWPVMGNADADWNIPEIWPVDRRDDHLQSFLQSATPEIMKEVYDRYGYMLNWKDQPNFDAFANACAAYVIRNKKPNATFLHVSYLDAVRHKKGSYAEEVKEALKRHDDWLGEIVQAAKDAGIYADTTFIVLGDHGLLDIRNAINLNVEFRKQGLITVDENDGVVDWKAYVNPSGCSAQVHLKHMDDGETRRKVEQILYTAKNNLQCIEEVCTREEALAKYNVYGDYAFMLEAAEGYVFNRQWTGQVVKALDRSKSNMATHGHNPVKGPQPVFIAAGKGIKPGVTIEEGRMIDEGPTMAALLGIELPEADGQVIANILK